MIVSVRQSPIFQRETFTFVQMYLFGTYPRTKTCRQTSIDFVRNIHDFAEEVMWWCTEVPCNQMSSNIGQMNAIEGNILVPIERFGANSGKNHPLFQFQRHKTIAWQ